MDQGIVGYQNVDLQHDRRESAGLHQPLITAEPHDSGIGQQRQGTGQQWQGYQSLDGEVRYSHGRRHPRPADEDWPFDCLTPLNNYISGNCVVTERQVIRHYSLFTRAIRLVALFCCGCLAIPCILYAQWGSNQVRSRKKEEDYLSARTCSWFVLVCNIFVFIFSILSIGVIIAIIIIIRHIVIFIDNFFD